MVTTQSIPVPAPSLSEEFGGSRLLVSDLRLAFTLANHARYRAIARLFGIGPDQANLLTLVLALTLADAAPAKVKQLLLGLPHPSAGDGLLAAGAWRQLLTAIAGPSDNATPFFGALLTIGLLSGTVAPRAVELARVVRTESHRIATGFHHRYGYIVDPGHWRARRAQRLSA